MMSEKELLASLALIVVSICVVAGNQIDRDYDKRSLGRQDIIPKPVRDDGLGSLLLKNLRFRQIDDMEDRSLTNDLLWALQRHADKVREAGQEMERKVKKRQNVSVSQLAELLHSLKTRGIEDDGVKLQSLRFGK